jgi:hypothetical protein
MHAPTLLELGQSNDHFTAEETAEFRRVVSSLLSVCAQIAASRSPDGQWQPQGSAFAEQRSEASDLLALLARKMRTTRRDLRAIDDRARQRVRSGASSSTPLSDRIQPDVPE